MKDRRVRKTTQAIQTAFAELLTEKSIEDITIKELCERADINKSTFYLHYKNIYDCAAYIRNHILQEIDELISPYDFAEIINHFPDILTGVMNIFEKNKDLYIPFLKSPYLTPALHKIKQLIVEKILEEAARKKQDTVEFRCMVSFIVSGIFGVLQQRKFQEINSQTTLSLADKIQHGFYPYPNK